MLQVRRKLLQHLKRYSTQPAVVSKTEEYEKQLKISDNLKNITRKQRTKKPQKPPFAKNIFLGIFDTDILTYPQEEKEEVENLESLLTEFSGLFKQKQFIESNTYSKYFRQNLADYRLLGLQCSQFLNGRESTLAESCRVLEKLSEHKLRDNIVANEQLGIESISKFGSDAIKKKYLPQLLSGELLSCGCFLEDDSLQSGVMKTTATLSPDKKSWVLNGAKHWVVNGLEADVFIVVATTTRIKRDTFVSGHVTVFVVEKDFGGINGIRTEGSKNELDMATITFNNTVIPKENVIGKVDGGVEVVKRIMNDFRLTNSATAITLSKKHINNLLDYYLQHPTDLYESDAVTSKLGHMSMNLYALESMVYLTTGLLDTYENQDCEMECAITKIFSAENLMNTSTICLDLLDSISNLSTSWSRKYHEESVDHFTLYNSNDNLKMVIGLLGLQHAGKTIQNEINKIRNPLHNSWFVFKRILKDWGRKEDDPKLTLELKNYLHPSAIGSADSLEYCVLRLQYITAMLLGRFGNDIVNKHNHLRRLADCIIDIYAMTACIGRASRAYCTGIPNSNMEMIIAKSFVINARRRIENNITDMYYEGYNTNDVHFNKISKEMVHFKKYHFQHPLFRNI